MAYAKVCVIPKCPHPTSARLADTNNEKRRDLCKGHALVTKKHYGDEVEVLAVWNELTMEDFDD